MSPEVQRPSAPQATRSEPRPRDRSRHPEQPADNARVTAPRTAQEDELFLKYRRPGALVGDPGPGAARDREVLSSARYGASQQISEAVYRWADTLLKRNLNEHMKLYAPVLDRFYDRENVPTSEIRQEKSREMDRYASATEYEIRGVRLLQPKENSAIVEFRKDVEFGKLRRSESIRQRLGFRQIDGEWRITSEEAVHVTSRR